MIARLEPLRVPQEFRCTGSATSKQEGWEQEQAEPRPQAPRTPASARFSRLGSCGAGFAEKRVESRRHVKMLARIVRTPLGRSLANGGERESELVPQGRALGPWTPGAAGC